MKYIQMNCDAPDKVIFTSIEHIDEKSSTTTYTEKTEVYGLNMLTKLDNINTLNKKRVYKTRVMKKDQLTQPIQLLEDQPDHDLR